MMMKREEHHAGSEPQEDPMEKNTDARVTAEEIHALIKQIEANPSAVPNADTLLPELRGFVELIESGASEAAAQQLPSVLAALDAFLHAPAAGREMATAAAQGIVGRWQTHLERGCEDASYATARALPRADARSLVRELECAGYEASDAPDHEDRSLAWVYVTLPA